MSSVWTAGVPPHLLEAVIEPVARSGSETDRRAHDRTEIGALLTEMTAAWGAGDAVAYGALFTPDARYVDVRGGISRGREEIVRSHRWLFERLAGSRMVSGADADREVTFLTSDVAVVLGVGGGTTLPDQPLDAARTSVVSLVVLRTDEGWRFAHFQNTRAPAPEAPGTA